MTSVVIAAGGAGRRFHADDSGARNKLLVQVSGGSILQYLASMLLGQPQVERVIVLTHHCATAVREHLQHSKTGHPLEFVQVIGGSTGAAVSTAAKRLHGEPFLYTDGDVLASPRLYAELVAASVESPARTWVSVSSRIEAPTHLMVQIGEDGRRLYKQGLRGESGDYVSLGVVAFGSLLSRKLARSQDDRDLDEVLEDALNDSDLECDLKYYDGAWAALHEQRDLQNVARFIESELK